MSESSPANLSRRTSALVADETAGTPRSIGGCMVLAVVTIGIYAIVWTYKTHDEIRRHSGSGVGGGIGLLIYIFAGIVTPFLLGSEISRMNEHEGLSSSVTTATGFWVLLPLVGPIVWFAKTQSALNDHWATHGTNLD